MIQPTKAGYLILGALCILTIPLLVAVGDRISAALTALMVAGAGWCLIRSQDGAE